MCFKSIVRICKDFTLEIKQLDYLSIPYSDCNDKRSNLDYLC